MRGWQPMETYQKGYKVIAAYRNRLGNWRYIMARYYLPGTLQAGDSCDDYDEDGCAPEGWYEESETHDEIMPCAETPLFWHPLPDHPPA